ncbi:MAG: hypothetical protein ACI83D_000594 [Planctomycetota bacterium]|jgi:hypothetical protein
MGKIFLWLMVGFCIAFGIYRSRSARKGVDAVTDCMTGASQAAKVFVQVILWLYFAPYNMPAFKQQHWWILLMCALSKITTAVFFWKYLGKGLLVAWNFFEIRWEDVMIIGVILFIDLVIGLIIQIGVKRKYPINTDLERILKGKSYWGFILRKLKNWNQFLVQQIKNLTS